MLNMADILSNVLDISSHIYKEGMAIAMLDLMPSYQLLLDQPHLHIHVNCMFTSDTS